MERLQSLSSQIKSSSTSVFVYKHMDPHQFQKVGDLKGKVIVISGASRGIGLAMGLRAARDGAKVAIFAKTTKPHPKLEGTIYTAADDIRKAGGQALAIKCDIRFEKQVQNAVQQVVDKFGGIDILINNASAISLKDTQSLDMKRYDLMMAINTRGTYLLSKACLPHLKKAKNPHILNISPPYESLYPKQLKSVKMNWFSGHVAYSIAKFGMTLCAYGMSQQFKDDGVAVNTLWPRTSIATAAVQNLLGGDQMMERSRTPEIMGDSAYVILTSNSRKTTGNFFIDDEVLASVGVKDLSKYRCNPKMKDYDLTVDFFC